MNHHYSWHQQTITTIPFYRAKLAPRYKIPSTNKQQVTNKMIKITQNHMLKSK